MSTSCCCLTIRLLIHTVENWQIPAADREAGRYKSGDMALVIYICYMQIRIIIIRVSVKRDSRELGCIGRGTVEVAMRNTMMDALPRIYYRPDDTVNPPYTKGDYGSRNRRKFQNR